jgi:membrane glycosyltransferase
MKKLFTTETILIIYLILVLLVIDSLCTSLYWEHNAVIHHAAFFEASSWGNVSFHWNDVSFAQTPFASK